MSSTFFVLYSSRFLTQGLCPDGGTGRVTHSQLIEYIYWVTVYGDVVNGYRGSEETLVQPLNLCQPKVGEVLF
jgi:hypothetical protein